jgi:hypothetical protein
MGLFDNDEPSGQQTVVQTNDPWSGLQTQLKTGYKKAEELLNTPVKQYPDSRVVPFSPQTENALQGYENRATNGSPVLKAGQDAIQKTASGDYLKPNPYFNQAVDAAIRPMTENFNENIMPGIASTFSNAGAGGYGSGLHMQAATRAADDLNRNISDMVGGLSYQNYADERTKQLGAAQLAPSMAAADYADLGQLERVGAIREGQAGAQLQDDISKFNFQQTEPRTRLAEYMALIAGGNPGGGTSSTTQPIYSNGLANGLGAASTAAGVAGTLFGQNGVFPGLLSF